MIANATETSKVLRFLMDRKHTVSDAAVYQFSFQTPNQFIVVEYSTKKLYRVDLNKKSITVEDLKFYGP